MLVQDRADRLVTAAPLRLC